MLILDTMHSPTYIPRPILACRLHCCASNKVETPNHDNDLIMTPILSPQSDWSVNLKLPGTSHGRF